MLLSRLPLLSSVKHFLISETQCQTTFCMFTTEGLSSNGASPGVRLLNKSSCQIKQGIVYSGLYFTSLQFCEIN
ncbi:hypothetical protein EXN66_Car004946 [Channa argus]|uniref:Uncharacterized protein n=1 Tax=Channa argus TaxID=215402 RepID=A0A6G1PGK3_CHAAH|nr:hypothetical protein EXN66_Car004946 [Channa argus]